MRRTIRPGRGPDRGSIRAFLRLFGIFLLAACGEDAVSPEPAAELAGSYDLSSVQIGSEPPMEPPVADGSLVLTRQGRYELEVVVDPPDSPGVEIVDEGTFEASGDSWAQESTVDGTQAIGTYELEGPRLAIDVTIRGLRIRTEWIRTG